MTIRSAVIGDLKELSAIENTCFPAAEACTEASFEDRLSIYPDRFWLLCNEDRIVSFVNGMLTNEADLTDEMYENASMHDPDGAWQMIFGVNTLPDLRRRGYAGQLLRAAIEQSRREGRKGLVLTCKEALIHYYASFGFVNEGVSASVHGNVQWYQMRIRF